MSQPPAAAEEPQQLRIEAVARRTGLTKRTIRYYEEIGLIAACGRSEGGFRLFTEADVVRLERIVALKHSAGFSLAEISELLDAESVRERIRERYRASDDPVAKRALLAESRGVLRRQLALIETKRRLLDQLAAEYGERLERIAQLDEELGREVAKR